MKSARCSQVDCGRPALARYFWPGQPDLFCCVKHAFDLARLAEAMGVFVRLERVKP